MKQKLKNTGLLIVLLLMLLFQYTQNIYRHVHRLSNGSVVVHAHPFSFSKENGKLPKNGHKHSKGEFIVLQVLESSSDFTFNQAVCNAAMLPGKIHLHLKRPQLAHQSSYHAYFKLRPPPSV